MNPRTRTTAACLRAAIMPGGTVQLTPRQLAEQHAPGEITGEVTLANLTRPAGDPPLWLGLLAGPALFALGALLLAALK